MRSEHEPTVDDLRDQLTEVRAEPTDDGGRCDRMSVEELATKDVVKILDRRTWASERYDRRWRLAFRVKTRIRANGLYIPPGAWVLHSNNGQVFFAKDDEALRGRSEEIVDPAVPEDVDRGVVWSSSY